MPNRPPPRSALWFALPTALLAALPACIPLLALVAVLPMLLRGPSCGHDFDFHLLSWLEAAHQFAQLHYPQWAYTPAWNAGEPRFLFYPPLSWCLGALLGLFLPWSVVPAAFTWIALSLSGLTMFRLALRYASPAAALLAATLYLANPYMLFTAYERTAYGELLAAAWLPLLFGAALRPQVRVPGIAIAVGLLWLTNAPAAVMGCYALAVLITLRLLIGHFFPARGGAGGQRPLALESDSRFLQGYAGAGEDDSLRPRRLALLSAAGVAWGLLLAAFYVLPAAFEQRFVQVSLAIIPAMSPSAHFLFHRMGSSAPDDLFHDQVVRTASQVSVLLLGTILLVAGWTYRDLLRRRRKAGNAAPRASVHYPAVLCLAVLAALVAFLLTPPSLFLWNYVPKLAFLQFPWRLDALLGVILSTLTAVALNRLDTKTGSAGLASLALAGLLVFPAWRVFHQRCFAEDTVPARVAEFQSPLGTEPTDEYTPAGDDGDALLPGDPPFWLLAPDADPGDPAPHAAGPGQSSQSVQPSEPGQPGPAPDHLVLVAPAPELLVLNRRQFPAWQLRLNGSPVQPALPRRHDGLIAVRIPAGADTIDLTLIRLPDQMLGLRLSALAAIGLAVQARLRRRKAR